MWQIQIILDHFSLSFDTTCMVYHLSVSFWTSLSNNDLHVSQEEDIQVHQLNRRLSIHQLPLQPLHLQIKFLYFILYLMRKRFLFCFLRIQANSKQFIYLSLSCFLSSFLVGSPIIISSSETVCNWETSICIRSTPFGHQVFPLPHLPSRTSFTTFSLHYTSYHIVDRSISDL